ncbi:MAG: hypothetical protein LBG60_15225 [Bifidobacteriaceae bacterium]|jgi:hypothetical protein|nr:hypothetical protein [Bifidobacteriaceae bacterium]
MGGNTRSTAVVALAALVALAVAVGTYFLAYAPALDERQSAITKAESVEKENDDARAELKHLASENEQLEEKKLQLEANRAQFPTSLELSDFTRYLKGLIDESQAKMVTISRSAPVQLSVAQPLPAGPGGKQAPVVPQPPTGLYQYSFNIVIEGEFDQTKAFLRLLQAEDARMFLVTSVALSPGMYEYLGEPGDVGQFVIHGYTYALVPQDQIPASSTEGGNDGG